MANEEVPDIGQLFAQRTPIQEALNEAVRQHKQAGLPMAAWKDGKVVWIMPDQLDADDQPSQPPPGA
jgi:hypothetical protein